VGAKGTLRFRKGSDYLRGILYSGRSPLYLGDDLEVKGSCLVSGKQSNSRGYLWLFFNLGEGYVYRGYLLNISRGMGKYKELNNNVSG